jgi:hypothetical protein
VLKYYASGVKREQKGSWGPKGQTRHTKAVALCPQRPSHLPLSKEINIDLSLLMHSTVMPDTPSKSVVDKRAKACKRVCSLDEEIPLLEIYSREMTEMYKNRT